MKLVLLLLKLFPWSEDLAKRHCEESVNVVEEKAKEPCTCNCEILKENLIDANKEIAELKKKLQETQELMAYYVLHRTPRPDI